MSDFVLLGFSARVLSRVARFFLVQNTKTRKYISTDHKISRMTTKYTKWTEHLPNGYKICHHLPLQDPPKFTQTGIWFENIPSGNPGFKTKTAKPQQIGIRREN
jgi:hypothetical protein